MRHAADRGIGEKRGRSGKVPSENIIVLHVVKNKAGYVAVIILMRDESSHAKFTCLGSHAGAKLNMDAAFACFDNGRFKTVCGKGIELAVTVIEDNSFVGEVVLAVFADITKKDSASGNLPLSAKIPNVQKVKANINPMALTRVSMPIGMRHEISH